MRNFALFTTLVSAFFCLASPVRSISGYRHIGYAVTEDENENPYVSEGLLAMWDGKWNVGFFEHDDFSQLWKDLSGNGLDIPVGTEGISWNSDSIMLSNSSVGTSIPSDKRQRFTIECVASSTFINQGAFVWMRNPGWVGGALLGWTSRVSFYYPWKEIAAIGDSDIHTFSLSWSPDVQRLVVDGEVLAETFYALDSRNVLSEIRIGEYNGSMCSNMRCYSVRLYDRQISVEEEMANSEIDRERFGF